MCIWALAGSGLNVADSQPQAESKKNNMQRIQERVAAI
jgi:hypothetical protein